MIFRNSRTPSEYIGYGLYFYFSGLSLRKAADSRLSADCFIKRNHVSIWNWIQKYNPQKISSQRKRKFSEYSCIQKDETVIKVGSEYIWIWWVATIEPESKEILGISISKEQNMFVAIERFISDVVEEHGRTSGFHRDGGTWYPQQACRFLKLNHHLHSFVYKDEKSIIERTMQYIKDRTMNVSMITFHAERRNVN